SFAARFACCRQPFEIRVSLLKNVASARYRLQSKGQALMAVSINGKQQAIRAGDRLIDVINRSGVEVPQVCYHPQWGPIQTCDTCMVEVNAKLVGAGARAGRAAWMWLR